MNDHRGSKIRSDSVAQITKTPPLRRTADISDSKTYDSDGDNLCSDNEDVDDSTSRWGEGQREIPSPVVRYNCNDAGQVARLLH